MSDSSYAADVLRWGCSTAKCVMREIERVTVCPLVAVEAMTGKTFCLRDPTTPIGRTVQVRGFELPYFEVVHVGS
jgi:hypothetical protein